MFRIVRNIAMVLATVMVAVSAMPMSADAQSSVNGRQGLMKSNGKNFGVIAAFVKKGMGTAAGAAVSARVIASNLAQFPNYFPEGTAQGTAGMNTRAKADIWQSWSKFANGAADVSKLALDLSLAAESGDKAAIGKAMGAMGQGCGGCHKAFRGPKN